MPELERRERQYRDDRKFPDVRGKTVILVDVGLATGSSMHAAVDALQKAGPARIVVGVPVSAPETCAAFREIAGESVCASRRGLSTPSDSGTRTSTRRPTTRCTIYYNVRALRESRGPAKRDLLVGATP
jgi:hypothetical protein